MSEDIHEDGFTITDLQSDTGFQARQLHVRDARLQMEGLRRLGTAFVEDPKNILQVLVEIAVDLCGADSAGITLEVEHPTESACYQWIAAAGEYRSFRDAIVPRRPDANGVTIERNAAQHVRVPQSLLDRIGSAAPAVSDAILMPWRVGDSRGILWIAAHIRTEAFDNEDAFMMKTLTDFAAMAVRHHEEQRDLLKRSNAAFGAAMANDLAHQINNPLQGLTNLMFLAAHGQGGDLRTLGLSASADLERLSLLVNKLLTNPTLS